MEFDEVIKERKSVRKYHPTKKPNWRDIIEAVDAGNRGPLAGNIGSVKFILVDDEETIQKIGDACQQTFIAQAPYVVVVCSDTREVLRSYDERGEMYIRQQAGAAIENFLLKITDLDLGSCWVGLFDDNLVKRAIKAKDFVQIEAVLPIGFSIDKTPRRRKIPLDNSLFFNTYDNRVIKPRKRVEAA